MVIEAASLLKGPQSLRALDLGCGEGKNSAALAEAGFSVLAIDKSEIAVGNALRAFPSARIAWLVADLLAITGPKDSFDLVIATGSLHCLESESQISSAVDRMKSLTKIGGLNVLYSFNDGPQDMKGHADDFSPTLLPHTRYLQLYRGWDLLRSSDITQPDRHPHNEVDHHHTITRLLARRLR